MAQLPHAINDVAAQTLIAYFPKVIFKKMFPGQKLNKLCEFVTLLLRSFCLKDFGGRFWVGDFVNIFSGKFVVENDGENLSVENILQPLEIFTLYKTSIPFHKK